MRLVPRTRRSIPRASGGVSRSAYRAWSCEPYSPRKRGCFCARPLLSPPYVVFPAQAGVFPKPIFSSTGKNCIPRASGGVSRLRRNTLRGFRYSPRKRGCFSCDMERRPRVFVFPAQAGVFPTAASSSGRSIRIPRASGGVSLAQFVLGTLSLYSPRKRGCFHNPLEDVSRVFVFPAQAGVFLRRFLSVRAHQSYSPRKRGCFSLPFREGSARMVFPAQAGVFPTRWFGLRSATSIPRASGGVSGYSMTSSGRSPYSPRKRGCFQQRLRLRRSIRVFPAQAGVFDA